MLKNSYSFDIHCLPAVIFIGLAMVKRIWPAISPNGNNKYTLPSSTSSSSTGQQHPHSPPSVISPLRTSSSASSFKVLAESYAASGSDSHLASSKSSLNSLDHGASSSAAGVTNGIYRRISATKDLLSEDIASVKKRHQYEHRKLGMFLLFFAPVQYYCVLHLQHVIQFDIYLRSCSYPDCTAVLFHLER